jgi:hypothetical protein
MSGHTKLLLECGTAIRVATTVMEDRNRHVDESDDVAVMTASERSELIGENLLLLEQIAIATGTEPRKHAFDGDWWRSRGWGA